MLGRALHLLRSRVSLKLTLTLVGFVAVSTLVAGLYLARGLEHVAVESVEARLATAARVLHDDARAASIVAHEAGVLSTSRHAPFTHARHQACACLSRTIHWSPFFSCTE